MGFLDKDGLTYLWGKVKADLSCKQDKLSGSEGQIVGFDSNGDPVAQNAPSGGLTQEEADALYLKQSGGKISGGLQIEGDISTLFTSQKSNTNIHVNGRAGETQVSVSLGAGGMSVGANGIGIAAFSSNNQIVSRGGELRIICDSPIKLQTYAAPRVDQRLTGVADPVNDNDAVNKRCVDSLIPPGVIVMWSGADVPDGWAICDGTNGTPDLRGRFVLGVGNNYSLGDTGGSETVALTENQMPRHSHIQKRVNDDGTYYASMDYGKGSGTYNIQVPVYTNKQFSYGASIITSAAGNSLAHPNMPPYYALYYIMKL